MNRYFNSEFEKKSSIFINSMFFLIHVALITYFAYFKVHFMVGVNVISIITYAVGFWILKKNLFKQWVWLMAYEVLLHMVLATLCLGTDFGFQYCFIGMMSLFFYYEYFSFKMERGGINGTFFGILSFFAYALVEVVSFLRKPPYSISPAIAFVTRLSMIFIVFVFVIITMRNLIHYTFVIEDGLEQKAEYDELTGLPNRHHMDVVFHHIFKDGAVMGRCLAMLDIDDFKQINDTYGHNNGDIVLKELAQALLDYKEGVKVARWGGEEFLILSHNRMTMEEFGQILEKIRVDISKRQIVLSDKTMQITVTIGASSYEPGESLEDWIHSADKRLYAGKCNGKNQIVC